jgi:4-hydroxy-2-oxoglutarate aldolase
MQLQGIFAALTVPFHSDGSLELTHLRDNIARYNCTDLAGYVVNGSTGEAVLLEWSETERILAAVREAAAPEKFLIAGTGAESTSAAIFRANRAAALGYRVALVRTPSYYKPQMSDDVLAQHFLRVAEVSRIPILVYSIPAFTGIAVDAPLVIRLAQHPNIIGIKDSSGDVQRAAEIISSTGRDFFTLVGSASTLYSSLAVGAGGAILAIADVFPELCAELYSVAREREAGRAEILQQILHQPSRLFSRLGIPAIKFAMDRLGFFGGHSRLPLLPLTSVQQDEVNATLATVAASAVLPRS